jgi:hypothetical protein
MAKDEELTDSIVIDIGEAAESGEFDAEIDVFLGDIVTAWRENSPEDSGEYKDSIQVVQTAEAGRGVVAATAKYANIIEYGSADTPEFAPMRRTVEQINAQGGTL